jgi:hypothetical protein
MGPLEYAEAWSWVYLIEQGPYETAGLIADHLADLRSGARAPAIAERLAARLPDPRRAWLRYYASAASATGR